MGEIDTEVKWGDVGRPLTGEQLAHHLAADTGKAPPLSPHPVVLDD